MELFRRVSEFLWNEDFWLPVNVTWEDMRPTAEHHYPEFYALIYPIPLALVIFCVRRLVEKTVYEPIGTWLEIPGRRERLSHGNDKLRMQHPALEAAFQGSNRLSHKDAVGLAKRCDMTERQVERWFRLRNGVHKSQISQLDKFKETGWRFTFYLGIFLYGLWALWDKPWFRDSTHMWTDYPYQSIDPDIWWYYMLEMGFYWSLLISQFFDVQRKDFWEMFFHHIITLCLMCFSWTDNTVRVGTMVLVIHDAVDFWLEGAKLAKYARKTSLSPVLFAIFAIVWIFTRLFVFPYRVIRYTFPCPMGDRCFPAFHLYNVLLGSLQVLHVFWTFTILRVIYRALNTGKTEDVRSDTEVSENEPSDDTALTSGAGDTAAGSCPVGDKLGLHNGNGCLPGEHANGDISTKLPF